MLKPTNQEEGSTCTFSFDWSTKLVNIIQHNGNYTISDNRLKYKNFQNALFIVTIRLGKENGKTSKVVSKSVRKKTSRASKSLGALWRLRGFTAWG